MTAAMAAVAQQAVPDSLLRRYAAAMLMVGFKGDSITPESDAVRYVRDLHVGGIILFDVDLTGTKQLGRATSPRASGCGNSPASCAATAASRCSSRSTRKAGEWRV